MAELKPCYHTSAHVDVCTQCHDWKSRLEAEVERLSKAGKIAHEAMHEYMAEAKRYREALEGAIKSFGADSVQGTGEYHTGLACGLEDRDITDKYDAMAYGYDAALERVQDEVVGILQAALQEPEEELPDELGEMRDRGDM